MKKVMLGALAIGFSATFDDGRVVRLNPGEEVEVDEDVAGALVAVEDTTPGKEDAFPKAPGGGGKQED